LRSSPKGSLVQRPVRLGLLNQQVPPGQAPQALALHQQ